MNEVITGPSVPLYVGIREQLRDQIAKLEVGDRLQSERELTDEFGVDRTTVRRAMQDLEREGYVVRHRGRGTFAARPRRPRGVTADKSRLVNLVIPTLEVPAIVSILTGIQRAAAEQGYWTIVSISDDSNDQEKQIIGDLMNQELKGALIVPFYTDSLDREYADLIRQVHESGTRVVLIDTYLPELDVPSVMCDKVRIGYMAAEHLIMLGHRRICYASSASFDIPGRDCLRGYKMALRDYGIGFDEKLIIDISTNHCAVPMHDAVVKMLTDNRNAFTALATPWFSTTYGAIKAFDDLGISVPDDVALVGGDLDQNPLLSHMTHTLQPNEKMGAEALALLIRGDDGENMKRHVLLQPSLVIGTSCGAKV